MTEQLTERYSEKIRRVLSCWGRVVITGTIPQICHAQAMTRELYARNVQIFDYPRFAELLRNETRDHAEAVARDAGLVIEYIGRNNFRKEERVKKIVAERGVHPGLVHIFSAMETCIAFRPWRDKKTGQTCLRARSAKCLPYYFYFIDPDLILCFLRGPTWAPFRLQFYFNGHNYLAGQLSRKGIGFSRVNNASVEIADFARVQRNADGLRVDRLQRLLNRLARQYCAVIRHFSSRYY